VDIDSIPISLLHLNELMRFNPHAVAKLNLIRSLHCDSLYGPTRHDDRSSVDGVR
jgi:hypothetical protein